MLSFACGQFFCQLLKTLGAESQVCIVVGKGVDQLCFGSVFAAECGACGFEFCLCGGVCLAGIVYRVQALTGFEASEIFQFGGYAVKL